MQAKTLADLSLSVGVKLPPQHKDGDVEDWAPGGSQWRDSWLSRFFPAGPTLFCGVPPGAPLGADLADLRAGLHRRARGHHGLRGGVRLGKLRGASLTPGADREVLVQGPGGPGTRILTGSGTCPRKISRGWAQKDANLASEGWRAVTSQRGAPKRPLMSHWC